ncbi:hypothetical protein AO068_23565 [Pseudomonas sp. ICMP 3272]|nr:hypothetical protein AO068_23565 [Pseudomonas sp. ICMP 3272]
MKHPLDISHQEYLIKVLTRDNEYALELYKDILTKGTEHEMAILMNILTDAGITNIVTNHKKPTSGSEK